MTQRRALALPPSPDRLPGLRELARVLYPEVFGEDSLPIVRDLHTRFYHQAPTEAQLESLLNAHGVR